MRFGPIDQAKSAIWQASGTGFAQTDRVVAPTLPSSARHLPEYAQQRPLSARITEGS